MQYLLFSGKRNENKIGYEKLPAKQNHPAGIPLLAGSPMLAPFPIYEMQ